MGNEINQDWGSEPICPLAYNGCSGTKDLEKFGDMCSIPQIFTPALNRSTISESLLQEYQGGKR